MLDSAVLDFASTGALLRLARNEGLLHENRWRTDAFLESRAPGRVPAWLRDQLLEQIVLTPKLATFQRLPREGLTGELLDSGILTSLEEPDVSTIPLRVPAEMVIGALHARGHKLPWQEVQHRFEGAWRADVEAQKFREEHGRPLPTDSMWVFARMRAFMNGAPNTNDEPPEGYTREDVAMAMRHRDQRWDAQPIFNAIDELLTLFAHAQQSNALFRPAIVPTRGRTVPVAEGYRTTARAGALFRLVARTLEVPTHGATLRSTLEIAHDPAAASLRLHLPAWLKELATGNIRPATLIEREIRHASEIHAKRATRTRVARVIGYFTVPLDVVEFFLNLPPLANLSVRYVAEVVKRKADERVASVEWVHFGSRRR